MIFKTIKNRALTFIDAALLSLFFLSVASSAIGADLTTGIGFSFPTDEKDLVEGDLICISEEGRLYRCDKPYDEKIFGVYLSKPQMVLRENEDDKPIVRQGKVSVNATTVNGEIKAGDNLTSSSINGKAQKATEPIGFILGKALTSFSASDGERQRINNQDVIVGKVETALNPGPQGVLPRGTVLDKLGYILVKGTQTPQAAGTFLRYIMAGLLVISVSLFALNNFGRNLNKGIEAIGRNPLARGQIHFAIAVNTALVAFLVLGAIVLGLVIIRI